MQLQTLWKTIAGGTRYHIEYVGSNPFVTSESGIKSTGICPTPFYPKAEVISVGIETNERRIRIFAKRK